MKDIQNILDQYKGNFIFSNQIDKVEINPDEGVIMIDTNKGIIGLFISDSIESLEFTIERLNEKKFINVNFIEVKNIDEKFYNIPAVSFVVNVEQRDKSIIESYKNYLNRTGVESIYYTLLFEFNRFDNK